MKRELYYFLKDFREPDGYIADFSEQTDFDIIPKLSGAYIFTSLEQKFIYPDGKSQVIYIGMSQNLNARIKKHYTNLSGISEMSKDEILEDWHYSRYLFMNKFGCRLFWYTTRGIQNGKTLERNLIESFYDRYLSLPIGNGAFSY